MKDCSGRVINYLRISVTDRCNLRCLYCMPQEGVKLLDHSKILTFDEIEDFTRTAVSMGIDKVRITGGEPLVRREITTLIKKLSAISGIKDLSMTSNGILLSQFARQLKEAGLMRINISMDSADPLRYSQITRGGDLNMVFKGIDASLQAGLDPVKINCVVDRDSSEPDALTVSQFAKSKGCEVRFIPKMDLEKGTFGVVEGGNGGECIKCNRLRITPTGMLRPCLFSDIEIDIRKLGAQKAIEEALAIKPIKGGHNNSGKFYNIGG